MGYKFSLVLSREITDDESVILKEAGCGSAVFGIDSLPTNADITVTKMDFDDTESPSLADAIESALEAVKKVPELKVPGLTVPAQPAGPVAEEAPAGEPEAITGEPEAITGEVVAEPAAKKPRARKTTKKAITAVAEPAEAS